ncbi:MAG: radical SAM protein [Victivallaceae bacterium]|nr:radical SAM protein [Victivallaceae bacterium]
MDFKKILLITPPVKTEIGPVRPSLGLGYLAQMLLENGIKYEILDMLLGYTPDDLHRKITEFKPDLLGVSLFSNKYKTAYQTIDGVKNEFPALKIVAGGPHVSCLQEKVLEDCPGIDYGVILEGEGALLELCRGCDPAEIRNLMYRKEGKVVKNPVREFIRNLDAVSFPRYVGFEIDKYIDEKAVISSRGCPYNCTYCAVKLTSGRQVRLRSPEKVVDEIEYWYKRGYRQFSFQDDNFTATKKKVFAMCDEIERRNFKGLFLRCAGARADKLDREVLGRMKAVGFKTIAIGVEVGNDKMLKIIKKGENFAAIDNAVKLATELDFDVYLNFLAGVPGETAADRRDAVDFALKYPVFYAEWSNLIPYPGTELYACLTERNYLLKSPDEYLNDDSTISNTPVFTTPDWSFKNRKKALAFYKKIRRKVLRRGLLRRLESSRIPAGIRHLAAYLMVSETFSKYLFQNRLRRIADLMRFKMYQAKGGKAND